MFCLGLYGFDFVLLFDSVAFLFGYLFDCYCCLITFSCVWVVVLVRGVASFAICVFVVLFVVIFGLSLRLVSVGLCVIWLLVYGLFC